jgi:hypothetical protein
MPIADQIDDFIESDSNEHNRIMARTSRAIALIGWLLIGFNLNGVIFSSFPLKLAQPEWQLNLITKFLSISTSLLLGAMLVTLALIFNPKEQILINWNRRVTRLASLFAVALVLSIPLQFYLGSRALTNQTKSAYVRINNLKSLVKGINSTNSENDLRLYLATLPNQPKLPDKFDAPFPVIKQRAIANLQAEINTAIENAKTQKSETLQVFLAEIIRHSAQCILIAAAFSALVSLNPQSANFVTKFFDSLI